MSMGRAVVGAVLAMPLASASADMLIPSFFSDHMVIQQKRPLKVFGKDVPGQKVTVRFEGNTATAIAGDNGKWLATITPPPAGGPYTLSISGSSSRNIHDVLVGEVWFCSGQSNMQMGIWEAHDGEKEIAAANHPSIRVFTVPNVRNLTPQDDVDGQWKVCSPAVARNFTAVGYYFGRYLQQELNVPVGLIDSSWGGTIVEAWTPADRLYAIPGMKQICEKGDADYRGAYEQYVDTLFSWLRGVHLPVQPSETESWAKPEHNDAQWKTMALPAMWQDRGVMCNGIMWFRKSVQLPADVDVNAPATLSLGAIDDFDITYVNGVRVGETDGHTKSFCNIPRTYSIPAGTLKPGNNIIAVRVLDFGGKGGMGGPSGAMQLKAGGTAIRLAGEWKYNLEMEAKIPVGSVSPFPPYGDWMNTELYNAMVHPFAHFNIAGAIWYQGESNVDRPKDYYRCLPVMIQSWRDSWNEQFPFFIVQLAGHQKDTGNPADSAQWAEFRDVQRRVAEETPNCGIALAIDIGNRDDVHPKNKQEVGRRLGLQVMKLVYGKQIVASGPTIQSAKAQGEKVVLSFDHLGSGLMAKEGGLVKMFAVQDKAGNWAWVDAQIDGNTVVLSSSEIKQPVTVRYAWQNTPPGSLYNNEGLPAMPFQVEVK